MFIRDNGRYLGQGLAIDQAAGTVVDRMACADGSCAAARVSLIMASCAPTGAVSFSTVAMSRKMPAAREDLGARHAARHLQQRLSCLHPLAFFLQPADHGSLGARLAQVRHDHGTLARAEHVRPMRPAIPESARP